MKSNEARQSKLTSWPGPAALLALAGAAGLWLGLTQGAYGPLALAVGLLALTAALGAVWLHHVLATRRQFAVWDAYAEQELARADRLPHKASRSRNQELSRSNV
jgi:hypothetical protein